ncbi:TPM domain-containing protein, partial [Micrococcus luteus]
MTVSARPADVGRLARAVTAAGLGGVGLLVAAPAAHAVAVPPGVYVVDEAGVLSTSDEQRLTQEIQDLRRDTGQGLYVVYVDEFSTDAQTLAQDVARQRGLGTNDSVLAIAVEERAYGLDSGGDADLQNQVTRTYVGPELSKIGTDPGSADWLAAGTAAVQGLDDAADGTLDGTGASGAEYDPAGAL